MVWAFPLALAEADQPVVALRRSAPSPRKSPRRIRARFKLHVACSPTSLLLYLECAHAAQVLVFLATKRCEMSIGNLAALPPERRRLGTSNAARALPAAGERGRRRGQ